MSSSSYEKEYGMELMQENQKYPSTSVVIPTHNEAQNLHYVLPLIPPIISGVILVDRHSKESITL
jgi:hypothetical protein